MGGKALESLRPDPATASRPDASERALLAAARGGDARATARLLERLARPVLRFGQGFCRNTHDAQDLAQDVMRTLLAELSRFRGDASLTTWAFVVARRACARRRRREARMRPLEATPRAHEWHDPHATPDVHAERGQLGDAIVAALAALPDAHREVVVMRDVEGMPAAEVARVLGIGERAVKSRLHRARLALRGQLAPHVGHVPARPTQRRLPGCPDTSALLSRYLEGDVDARDCDALAAHVAGCPDCGEACASLRDVLGACRRWGTGPLRAPERAQVRAAIRRVLAEAG